MSSGKKILAASLVCAALLAVVLMRFDSSAPPEASNVSGVDSEDSKKPDLAQADVGAEGENRLTLRPGFVRELPESVVDSIRPQFADRLNGVMQEPRYVRHRVVDIDTTVLLRAVKESLSSYNDGGNHIPVVFPFFDDVIVESRITQGFDGAFGAFNAFGTSSFGDNPAGIMNIGVGQNGTALVSLSSAGKSYLVEVAGEHPHYFVVELSAPTEGDRID